MVTFAGAVLTGGASRRMGHDKAVMTVDGRPLVVTVATALTEADVSPVFAVGGDAGALAALGMATVGDDHPGVGPLGGIATALVHVGATPSIACTHVVVVACDLPRLRGDTVRRLTAAVVPDVDVVVARTDRLEPLCAVWSVAGCSEPVEAALAGGERAVHRVLERLRVVTVDVDHSSLVNVNSPTDLPGHSG